jgi:outer membrane receptor protein involved in Fe transport
MADFLLGLPFLSLSSKGSPGGNARKTEIGAYVQDDWKVNPDLTLSYGLRWEYYGRITEKLNKQSIWSPTLNQIIVAGVNGVPPQLVDDDYNNFAPRFGFALRPFGSASTVIRGASGIFYDNDMRHNSEIMNNPPFVYTQQFVAAQSPSLSFNDPFPSAGNASSLMIVTLNQHYRDTYAEHWSLGVQRQIGNDFLLDVSYVGNHLVKARRLRNVNQPIGGQLPYAGFGPIILFEQAGSSNFNALESRVERRFQTGLTFTGAYTWGHAIDDRPGQGAGPAQNNYNFHAERADADFDVRHRLTFSTVWEVPAGRNRRWGGDWSPFIDALFGGWGLSGIAMMQGGRPFTVNLAQDISGAGNMKDRPNLVPGVSWKPDHQTPDHWINPQAFTIPARGTFGNLGRNTLRGPRLNDFDLALMKEKRAREDLLVQVRAEFFNIFNHPNFAPPNATLDASSLNPASTGFGVIPATISPERQIQLGLRLEF